MYEKAAAIFGKLYIDVDCLLVSLGSLDKGHTRKLIADYMSADLVRQDARQLEVRALRDGLNNAIMPFYVLFEHRGSTCILDMFTCMKDLASILSDQASISRRKRKD